MDKSKLIYNLFMLQILVYIVLCFTYVLRANVDIASIILFLITSFLLAYNSFLLRKEIT